MEVARADECGGEKNNNYHTEAHNSKKITQYRKKQNNGILLTADTCC